MAEKIRVAICDQSPVIRHGLRDILSSDSEVEVVGQATSPRELVGKFDRGEAGYWNETDIILSDFEENGQSVIGFLRDLGRLIPSVKIIVLNDCKNRDRLVEAIELGIKGFQCKHDSSPHLCRLSAPSKSSCMHGAQIPWIVSRFCD